MRAILIVQGGSIGDVLLSLPALAELQQNFPGARLHLLARASVACLLQEWGAVEEACDLEDAKFLPLFGAHSSIPDELRRWAAEFDLGIVWLRGGELVARRLGEAGIGQVLVLPPYPAEIGAVHASDHLLQTLAPLGVEAPARPISLPLGIQTKAFADGLWARFGLWEKAPVVAIHPGSGSRRKNWPAYRFAQVADWIARGQGGNVLVIAGPADDEAVAGMLAGPSHKAATVKRESLSELAAVLERCDAYLGNDSGVTHLASLVGTPTLALFGPTDPRVWAPRGKHVAVVASRESCAPCLRSVRSKCKSPACLESISTERVINAFSKVLSQWS